MMWIQCIAVSKVLLHVHACHYSYNYVYKRERISIICMQDKDHQLSCYYYQLVNLKKKLRNTKLRYVQMEFCGKKPKEAHQLNYLSDL